MESNLPCRWRFEVDDAWTVTADPGCVGTAVSVSSMRPERSAMTRRPRLSRSIARAPPARAAPGDRCRRQTHCSLAFVDPTVLHHEPYVLNGGDVRGRVARYRDDVGQQAGR